MNDSSSRLAWLASALEAEVLADIPLLRSMGFSIAGYDGNTLRVAAPLAPNVNDKGCAFGGSLVSLMTVAGWGVLRLALAARDLHCDIFVADSQVRYLAPVWQDFEIVARLADGETFDSLFDGIARRGKARLGVDCHVPLPDGSSAATLSGSFVAKLRR